jgi:hypothetical protein
MKEGKVTEYDKELQTGFGERRVGRIIGNDSEEFEIRKLDESLQTGFFEKKVGRIVKTSSSGGGGAGGFGFFENIVSSIFGTLIFLAIGEIILFCVIPDIIKKMGMKLLLPTFFWVLTIILSKKIDESSDGKICAILALLFVILALMSTGSCVMSYLDKALP